MVEGSLKLHCRTHRIFSMVNWTAYDARLGIAFRYSLDRIIVKED